MHWCSSHLILQSHPHQTSLITFTFVLRFCADYLGSLLQETEDKPLAVQLRKFPLYTFLKITNMQAPTTRGANSLVLPCERGIQPGFPRAGGGCGCCRAATSSPPVWCSSNEFGTYGSQVYSAGLAQRDKWNVTTFLGGCCYHRHGWNFGRRGWIVCLRAGIEYGQWSWSQCSCMVLNMWHFEIISDSIITHGRDRISFVKQKLQNHGWNKIWIQGNRSKTPFRWGQ